MKTTETGISLNPEQKRLIGKFAATYYEGFADWRYFEEIITALVERCIYADREVINQNNE